MQKIIITILNVIAASPILLYPVFLITSIMVFDAPGSEGSTGKVLISLSSFRWMLIRYRNSVIKIYYNHETTADAW